MTFTFDSYKTQESYSRGKCGLVIRKSDFAKTWQILSDSDFKCDLQANIFEPVE